MDALDFPKEGIWLNTREELTLKKLKGHVVLLDFWTYCCINCIHVLDDLRHLEKKYDKDPFIVIGVHSPKFQNEKEIDNVRSAIARYEISHPILMDNDLILWRSYGINAWPSFVLIDPEGQVIGKTSGEGKKQVLDIAINNALEAGREKGTLSDIRIEIQKDITFESLLKFPGKISLDKTRNHLFVSDSNHNRILEVKLEKDNTGKIVNIIGSGESGNIDGSFEAAKFNKPQGIIIKDSTLYVADTENHSIRKVDLKNKTVTTISGMGTQGNTKNYKGDPLKVPLNSPWDLAIAGAHLFIAMAGTHQIWRLDLLNNIIESFAGSGREDIIDGNIKDASLAQPSGLAYEKKSNRLYFADSEVSGVRYIEMDKLEVNTLIGRGLFTFGLQDGHFIDALLQHPLGLDINENSIYIADTYNHALRRADLEENQIESVIHRPRKGVCKIGDEDCDKLPLYEPNDVLIHDEKIYIADTNNHLIRVYNTESKDLEDLYILE